MTHAHAGITQTGGFKAGDVYVSPMPQQIQQPDNMYTPLNITMVTAAAVPESFVVQIFWMTFHAAIWYKSYAAVHKHKLPHMMLTTAYSLTCTDVTSIGYFTDAEQQAISQSSLLIC